MTENVDLQLVLKRVDAVLAGQDAIRAELASLNETVRSLARSQVSMQRDIATLKDRVIVLTAAQVHTYSLPRGVSWKLRRDN
jgi:hypothetical protein